MSQRGRGKLGANIGMPLRAKSTKSKFFVVLIPFAISLCATITLVSIEQIKSMDGFFVALICVGIAGAVAVMVLVYKDRNKHHGREQSISAMKGRQNSVAYRELSADPNWNAQAQYAYLYGPETTLDELGRDLSHLERNQRDGRWSDPF